MAYHKQYPQEASYLRTSQLNTTNIKNDYHINDQVSTRKASQNIMNQLVKDNPQFWGGAADLSSSNKTYLTNQGDFTDKFLYLI